MKKLLAIPYTPLPEHIEMFKRFKVDKDLFREENIPIWQKLEELNSSFDKLNGSVAVELEGEKVTIPQARVQLLNPERNLRERTWKAMQKASLEISKEADKLFLELLPLRQQMARNTNLKDFRDYTWLKSYKRFDYTPQEALEFISSIEHEVVPVLASHYKQYTRLLGVETLRPWDIEADPYAETPLKPFNTLQELEDGLERIFTNLDPILGKQFASMRKGWMDLDNRPNKLSDVGYCSYFPVSKMPYVYHSINGTQLDVWVMLHEIGHAFHSFAAGNAQPLFWNHYPSQEFSEVASQAMELLALPYYEKSKGGFYSPKDANRAKQNQLITVLRVFVSSARNSALQHWLYSEALAPITAEDIDKKWLELRNRFYPFIDWSNLDSLTFKSWQHSGTFHNPFYDLEYAIAYLGAIQIWQNSLKDPKQALEQYRNALSLGASCPLPELFKAAGATFAFDRTTVRNLIGFVSEQLNTLE
jgi:oligoendopeptidase F